VVTQEQQGSDNHEPNQKADEKNQNIKMGWESLPTFLSETWGKFPPKTLISPNFPQF
jgi:hypothetical protein